MSLNYKLVVFVPISHADIVRKALAEAGAGKIGNYDACSFSSKGTGRYRGNEWSNPSIGSAGNYESTEEERIEVIVPSSLVHSVVAAMKKAHPYEEVAYDLYTLVNLEDISSDAR